MNIVNFLTYEKNTGRILQTGATNDTCLEFYDSEDIGVLSLLGNSDTHYINLVTLHLNEYTDDELAYKSAIPIGHIWKLPERIVFDPRSLDEARDHIWTQIKYDRTLAELSPFTCDGFIYDSNKEQISGAVQMALLSQISQHQFSIDWTLADNSLRTHTAQDMINVGIALGRRVSDIYDLGRSIRIRIDKATTITELKSIVWDL